MIRKLNLGDLVRLEKYAKFPMPNVNDPRVFIQWALLNSEGKLIGAAFVKRTCEVSMILDPSESRAARIKSWVEAFDLLDQIAPLHDQDDVHAFVLGEDAEHHAKLMKKLGFIDATGIPLYYRIGESKWLKDRRSKQQQCLQDSREVPQLKLKQDYSEGELLVVA